MTPESTRPTKIGWFQVLLFFLCGSAWGISMSVQVFMGIVLSEIKQEWEISYVEESMAPNLLMVGICIGSYLWGHIGDQHGRMAAFKQSLLYIAGGCFLGFFSPDIWVLSFSYMLIGFGIGGSFAVDGTVFCEHAPAESTYLLIALSIFIPIFIALGPALSWMYNLVHTPSWRYVQGTLGIITLCLAIPRFWIHETPMYLKTKVGNLEQNGDSESNLELNKIPSSEIFFVLFRKPLRRYTLLYIAIWSGIMFTFPTVFSFLPVILERSGFRRNSDESLAVMLYQQGGKA